MEWKPLQFQPFNTIADLSFWRELGRRKLEEYKLSDATIKLHATYEPSRSIHLPGSLSLRKNAFVGEESSGEGFHAKGVLVNKNTLEDFKSFDKKGMLFSMGNALREDIENGIVETDPTFLVRFLLLTFADLKRHTYVYWFAFPALVNPQTSILTPKEASTQSLTAMYTSCDLSALSTRLEEAARFTCKPFFLCRFVDSKCHVLELTQWAKLSQEAKDECRFAYVDPCPLPEHPGWVLRNYLYFIRNRCREWSDEEIISLRRTVESSVVIHIHCEVKEKDKISDGTVQVVGWQANPQGKIGPRKIDLSAHLDPVKLSSAACNLNLKLMRWRALPQLDTAMLEQTSCLLLGSGTLGCNVARSLLGWGFRKITMVDNGRVSYSNPVRQSLYTFNDCKNGGAFKAEAACKALREIVPDVEAEAEVLTIPMPGHFVTKKETEILAKEAVDRLETLIQGHQVIFLLTDTRESRWLPSLLAAKHDKVVLNTALGFDSFLVMRHGSGVDTCANRLGCYFCNDVVAPCDSTKDRTLDQQCTVTRPGLAPIASAIAVEVLVNLLHRPSGNQTEVLTARDDSGDSFGFLPHQIRGSMYTLENSLIQGPAFDQCTACSPTIINAYEESGFELLLKVFNHPDHLEELTGLAKLKAAMEEADFEVDWAEDE